MKNLIKSMGYFGRFLCLVLSLCMVFAGMPMMAFAEEQDKTKEQKPGEPQPPSKLEIRMEKFGDSTYNLDPGSTFKVKVVGLDKLGNITELNPENCGVRFKFSNPVGGKLNVIKDVTKNPANFLEAFVTMGDESGAGRVEVECENNQDVKRDGLLVSGIGTAGAAARTAGGGSGVAATPVTPTPVEPTPIKATPIEPTPVTPTPIEPTPITPTQVEPTPVTPTPVKSAAPQGSGVGPAILIGGVVAAGAVAIGAAAAAATPSSSTSSGSSSFACSTRTCVKSMTCSCSGSASTTCSSLSVVGSGSQCVSGSTRTAWCSPGLSCVNGTCASTCP